MTSNFLTGIGLKKGRPEPLQTPVRKLVNPVDRLAMFTKSHDFIHLQFRNSKTDQPKIVEFYEKELSLREIESKTGVAKTVVRKILLKAKIPLRNFAKENPNKANFLKAKSRQKPPYGFNCGESAKWFSQCASQRKIDR